MRGFDSKWQDVPHFHQWHYPGGIDGDAEFGPHGANGLWGELTIRRKNTLIDDTAIWKQILLQTGQHE